MVETAETLTWFTNQMAKKLAINSHKGGWKNMSHGDLLRRLGQETAELRRAIKKGKATNITAEAADVANFAMMIADNATEYGDKEERNKK